MTAANPNFQPVKAYGRLGDMKNDGFDAETGTYYQVFAPEDIMKYSTGNEAVKKLHTDFSGLYSHWDNLCPIKQFFFVIQLNIKECRHTSCRRCWHYEVMKRMRVLL